ncbi:ATP-binding protein [Amycolatopsis sp. GM8]|uniref:ATP-binding protein n=1 Tax=Amycolatopsis sp. GM8 TaxID=2896530 RepID=UPI001F3685BF|nr:ATP-binding protein [Amycolatopsis sp. GM8]
MSEPTSGVNPGTRQSQNLSNQTIVNATNDFGIQVGDNNTMNIVMSAGLGTVWLTNDEFFRPNLSPGAILSHAWEFVGRASELETIYNFVSSDGLVFVISGRGGLGKSRLLRKIACHVEQEHQDRTVLFLAPQHSFQPESIDKLPLGSYLLIIDDVHDRDDLDLVVYTAARSLLDLKIIFATRPYGKSSLIADLRTYGMIGIGEPPLLDLSDIELGNLELLAREVLTAHDGPVDASQVIARTTRDCPLFTVIAGQLIAAGVAQLHDLVDNDTTRSFLVKRFRDDHLGRLGTSSDHSALQGILELVALLQPVIVNSDEFREVAVRVIDERWDYLVRLIGSLEEAGVLLRRGRKVRVVPDLLGDFLVAEACFNASLQMPTGYADLVFSKISGTIAQNLIVNIAKLDWRISIEHETESRIMEQIWQSLTSEFMASGILERQALLTSFSNISYYQPARSIALAKALIENPVEVDESAAALGPKLGGYNWVLRAIPQFLRGAALHIEHVSGVCDILWTLGREFPANLNSQADHAVRILQDLVSYQPNKPVGFSSRIVDRAITWTADPSLAGYFHSPLDVLDSALATEGYSTEANGHALTMRPFAVRAEAVSPLRERIISRAIELLYHSDLKVGARAARSLGSALQYPIGSFGREITEDERASWIPEFVHTLENIKGVLQGHHPDALVEDGIRQAVSRHARYGEGSIREAAREILDLLSDDLTAKLTRSLLHGWAHSAFFSDEDDYLEREQQWHDFQLGVARQLQREVPNPHEALGAISERIISVLELGNESGNSGSFMSILCDDWPDLAVQILEHCLSGPDSPFFAHSGAALASVRRSMHEKYAVLLQRLLESGLDELIVNAAWTLLWIGRSEPMSQAELQILSTLASSDSDLIKNTLARGLSLPSEIEAAIRIDLLTTISINGSTSVASEIVGSFGQHGELHYQDLSDGQIGDLLESMIDCPTIDDYNIESFLAEVSKTKPFAVLAMFERRVARAAQSEGVPDYQALPYLSPGHLEFRFRTSRSIVPLIRLVADTVLVKLDIWQYRHWWPYIFKMVVGHLDDEVLHELNQWAGSTEPRRLQVAALLLGKMSREFIWTKFGWVRDLLERADQIGSECYSEVSRYLHGAVLEGIRHGTPGEPFPEDVEQYEKSRAIASTIPIESPAHAFYVALQKSAKENINWSVQRDEEQEFE